MFFSLLLFVRTLSAEDATTTTTSSTSQLTLSHLLPNSPSEKKTSLRRQKTRPVPSALDSDGDQVELLSLMPSTPLTTPKDGDHDQIPMLSLTPALGTKPSKSTTSSTTSHPLVLGSASEHMLTDMNDGQDAVSGVGGAPQFGGAKPSKSTTSSTTSHPLVLGSASELMLTDMNDGQDAVSSVARAPQFGGAKPSKSTTSSTTRHPHLLGASSSANDLDGVHKAGPRGAVGVTEDGSAFRTSKDHGKSGTKGTSATSSTTSHPLLLISSSEHMLTDMNDGQDGVSGVAGEPQVSGDLSDAKGEDGVSGVGGAPQSGGTKPSKSTTSSTTRHPHLLGASSSANDLDGAVGVTEDGSAFRTLKDHGKYGTKGSSAD